MVIENWSQDCSSKASMKLYADLIGYLRKKKFPEDNGSDASKYFIYYEGQSL